MGPAAGTVHEMMLASPRRGHSRREQAEGVASPTLTYQLPTGQRSGRIHRDTATTRLVYAEDVGRLDELPDGGLRPCRNARRRDRRADNQVRVDPAT
jgi:hypothetical protein